MWAAAPTAARRRCRIPGSVHEEPLELRGRIVETVPPEAVVHDRSGLGDRHETGGPKLGQVVLDRRLREVELLGDLGEVQVARGEELEDPQSGLVTERAM